jgi:prevent-host-death family protein
MQKIVGVTELQRRFKPVIDEVVSEKTACILTRGSRPQAVLIPYEEYVRYKELQESEILRRFDSVFKRMKEHNRGFSDDEVDRDIAHARRKK